MNLCYLSDLLEGGNTLAHDRNFPRAIKDFLYGNWGGVASVDDALVMTDGREVSTVVENTPIFLDQIE